MKVLAFDFERDSPRTKAYLEEFGTAFQIASHFISHGETVMALLDDMTCMTFDSPTLLLLDEPDLGLSPRSAHTLQGFFHKPPANVQVLAALHNPVIISSFEEVLSLEHNGWVTSKRFLEDQVNPEVKAPWRLQKKPKPAPPPKLAERGPAVESKSIGQLFPLAQCRSGSGPCAWCKRPL